ncbi:BnaA05g11490D [Brassica napus]|uniref:RING-type E3 ubiquitin transferase n=3 Tax=Brassica TaxID=3705 RepID=A0A078FCR4_BRANA|nr:unnamed protein product [Brassica napus]CDY10787.1 BnaA05g11490D [Brassica napus]
MAGLVTSTRQQSPSNGNQISSSSRSLGGENDDTNCSAKLLDLEALNCPICCVPLTSNIFQCDNGHIACPTCCNKLRNKCPSCALPIGLIRCRAMERVIKAVIVPCPNSMSGCIKKFSYGNELTHEKECSFSRCYCPARNCNYTGSYKDLYSHFKTHNSERGYSYKFLFGEFAEVYFVLTEYTSVVMRENEAGLLFVVQCFSEPYGVYVTVSCIAPSADEIGEFSCFISTTAVNYSIPHNIMTFKSPKVMKIRKLSSETPEKDFFLVPSFFFPGRQALKLRICISKLEQE